MSFEVKSEKGYDFQLSKNSSTTNDPSLSLMTVGTARQFDKVCSIL